ncbi:TPA: hypothetical protein HA331_04540 [Pyrococcus horikoshii]|uniref:Uncharacterized protein n=1 Tax=Pyrococcus horikoshii TaxID=53953 RepID=A0A832T6E2_PYRHR|nr:hypothetical protein [Pyrococcus horikoshii]
MLHLLFKPAFNAVPRPRDYINKEFKSSTLPTKLTLAEFQNYQDKVSGNPQYKCLNRGENGDKGKSGKRGGITKRKFDIGKMR